MSDDIVAKGVAPVDPEGGAPAPKSGKGKGFLATRTGRIVLVAVGVAVILGIIAVVAVLVLGMFSGAETSSVGSVPVAQPGGAPGAKPSAVAASQAPTQPPVVPSIASRDVFSPRDPFEVIKPPVVPSETVKVDENILVLKDIVTEDGVRKGVFTLNGVQFVGGPGEVLGTTNWKVLAVHDSSVDVLYGDDRVALSVGQGIQK